MEKYRKKPVVIEAEQFDFYRYLDDGYLPEGVETRHTGEVPATFCKTLEGELHVTHGDWIIKGIQGEYYPCKPDIFEKLYEPIV
jgi:hypothetical protein